MIETGTGKFNDRFYFFDKPASKQIKAKVKFVRPFANPPVVTINLTSWISNENFQGKHDLVNRFNLTTAKVSTDGFEAVLCFYTNKIYPAREFLIKGNEIQFSWMAYDEVTIGG